MKTLSIDPRFRNPASSKFAAKSHTSTELAKEMRSLPFNEAYDLGVLLINAAIKKQELSAVIELLTETDAVISAAGDDTAAADNDRHMALLQLIAAAQIEAGRDDDAMVSAATLLNLMAQAPKRKDEPFLAVLAALLHDIAYIHSSRGQYKQAERELEKSMKLYERLAKSDAERYAPAHIMAQNASTQVYRSRVKQVNMLAHNQVATSTYLEMMNSGIEGAAQQLIDSLAAEGRTLAQMGRYREAVQYFSRALKYLTKIEPEMDERQLQLSIDLGEALLNVNVSRDKGIHLLNTMLHKATKLNALDQHRRIVDILLNAKSRRLDILDIWHKVFPR